jgi:proline iminopeptidase
MRRRELLTAGVAGGLAAGAGQARPPAHRAPLSKGDALNAGGVRANGVRMVPVVGGKYKVWTRTIGEGPINVLTLHGGPGFTHEYLEVMEDFLRPAGIQLIFYDQLGSHYSDQPDDPSLWNLPRFVEEVEEVRRALGLEHFVLYGHSWGGMLGIDYALKYQQHLRGLVISNMTAGIQSLLRNLDRLKREMLTQAEQKELAALEQKQDYDSPAYQHLVLERLYPQMLCRLKPWPESLNRSERHANIAVYNQMQGKSEFLVTGNMKDWERWDRLREIKVRTLTIGARYDEMDPEDMRRMARLMPNAVNAYCPNGSHLALWDDQAVYFRQLLRFLRTL